MSALPSPKELARAVQNEIGAFGFDHLGWSLCSTEVVEAEGRTFIHVELDHVAGLVHRVVEFDLTIQNVEGDDL